MGNIVLFDSKDKCCACGACMNACPKGAISMKEDEYGYRYPFVEKSLCIECGACKRACAYQSTNENRYIPNKVYVAANTNQRQIMKSASGGIFSAVATKFLQEGGVVFGATLSFEENHAYPHHIMIEKIDDLFKLQGSKYVQSAIDEIYREVKKQLDDGRKVLFSGTPCQVGGLYGYLKKRYDSLYTIDLICHGVPSAKFFDDYMQVYKDKLQAREIIDYFFRDKTKGWGMFSNIIYVNKRGQKKEMHTPSRLTSYNTLFLNGDTYRENCYSCKYAGKERIGDLTIGDYWGIEIEHPELLASGKYDEKYGISCILVNTNKGQEICDSIGSLVQMDVSEFEKVSKKNGQLNKPTVYTAQRHEILKIYKQGGYKELERWFLKKYRKQLVVHYWYNKIPRSLRLKLKKIFKG